MHSTLVSPHSASLHQQGVLTPEGGQCLGDRAFTAGTCSSPGAPCRPQSSRRCGGRAPGFSEPPGSGRPRRLPARGSGPSRTARPGPPLGTREQPQQWGDENGHSRVGPPTGFRARTSSPCARHPATQLVRVWRTDTAHHEVVQESPYSPEKPVPEKRRCRAMCTQTVTTCVPCFHVCVFHPYSTLYFPPRLGQPV